MKLKDIKENSGDIIGATMALTIMLGLISLIKILVVLYLNRVCIMRKLANSNVDWLQLLL